MILRQAGAGGGGGRTATVFKLHAGGYSSGYPTWIDFSRNEVTVDPSGDQVAANVPRFDHLVSLAPVPAPDFVFSSPLNPDGALLASGVDLNDSRELMVWLHRADGSGDFHAIYVFADGVLPSALPSQSSSFPPSGNHVRRLLTPRTLVLMSPEGTGTTTFYDLFNDSDTRPTINGKFKAYEVIDGSVYHGAIVLALGAFVETSVGSGQYERRGFGFALSNDRGATWTLIGDDVHDPAQTDDQAGWPRGAFYCIRAAPICQRTGAKTECWFSVSDYRKTVGETTIAGKGRAYVFKLTRTGSGAWSAGALKPSTFTDTLTHVHTAQITEYGTSDPPGLQMVVSIGDTQKHNRFARYVLPSITSDYTSDGNWTKTEEFHGRFERPEESDPGSWSQQPASVCFGPTPGSIIWGSDTCDDWINVMDVPNSSGGQAPTAQAYGLKRCGGDGFGNPFQATLSTIKDRMPELAGSSGSDAVAIILGGEGDTFRRLLYTPVVSTTVDTWAQVAATRGDADTSVAYGSYLYYCNRNGHKPFKRIAKPEITRLRPVVLSPGGINLAQKDCDHIRQDVFENTIDDSVIVSQLTEDSSHPGQYLDGSLLLPKIPSKPAAVFKVETSRQSTTPSGRPAGAGQMLVSQDGSDTLNWDYGIPIAPGDRLALVRRWRSWILDGSYQHGSFTPNKTTSMSLHALSGSVQTYNSLKFSCGDRWCPQASIGRRQINQLGSSPGPFSFPLEVLASDVGTKSDDNYFYLAVAEALDGNGDLPYPIAPTEGSTNPTATADEVLHVTGMSLGSASSWQVRVAGMHAIGGWDHYASRGTYNTSETYVSNRIWPLFHIRGSSGSSERTIEFLADCENKGFMVSLRSPGGSRTDYSFGADRHIWFADSPLYVTIAFTDTTATPQLIVGASLGGDEMQTLVIKGPFADSDSRPVFTELRFHATTAESNEVVGFRWFGGDYDNAPASVPTEKSVEGSFASLSFLE